MENILPTHLQEVIFSSSDSSLSKQISRLEKAGKLRKIASRIYSPNFSDTPETIVRRNLFVILGKLYPGSILSHRSALEFQPTSEGHIFLTSTYTKRISMPGLTLRLLQGPAPIDGDNIFSGGLYCSQQERAFLENLQESRQPGPESKTLTLPEIEERLDKVILTKGEAGLNEFRDKAKAISVRLDMVKEFEKLNKLISALLTTHPSKTLSSPLAIARALGSPYDSGRLPIFEKLFVELQQHTFKDVPDQNQSIRSFRSFAFFEAYFSNYIEGTEFELTDARHIVETDTPMPARDEDSHDVLGTYKLVSNKLEMSIVPDNPDQLLEILLYRHKVLMSARTSKNPGAFKDKNNRAGDSHFVDYTLVKGTLKKGFDFYQALANPFARAAYILFLISEVHPFLDGNGRMARIMMNAELVSKGQTRIIIPTVFRDDYLGVLRKLTRQQDPAAYVKMLLRAREFSATIVGDDMDLIEKHLYTCHAFKEPEQGKLRIPG